jgi:hypothetical protein
MKFSLRKDGLDLLEILNGWNFLFQPGRFSHTIENCKLKNENSRKYSNAVGAAHSQTWEPLCGLPYVFSKSPLNPPRFRVVPTLEKGDDISPPFSKGGGEGFVQPYALCA